MTYTDGKPVEHKNLMNRSDLKSELIVIIQKENGQKVYFNSRTVSFDGKIFIAPFPNPEHNLLNSGIEYYNYSISKLVLLKNDCQLDNDSHQIFVLNIGIDNTNKNFNDLVKFKMMSVISLVTLLEAFLNQIILSMNKQKMEK